MNQQRAASSGRQSLLSLSANAWDKVTSEGHGKWLKRIYPRNQTEAESITVMPNPLKSSPLDVSKLVIP
ncbi:MAG TPA: hypothetical protein VHS31_16305 [Tepidisphaeraceae bacterium]|jgi:hypothetical protein|nr:hypothetical protein [Tepidisphaeraceae bacterium]